MKYDYTVTSDWKVRIVRIADSKTVALNKEQSDRFFDSIERCESPRELRRAMVRWWLSGLRNERAKR